MALLDLDRAPHGGSQRHLPEWQSQPAITPTAIIDHSIVGSGEGAFGYFWTSTSLEAHFIVCGAGDIRDGYIWQLMDTGRQADANLQANGYAVSIETGDQGDPDSQPWTRAQLDSLIWLHAELRRVHPTIPGRRSRSCADPAGHGYHTMHGAPSCWTNVAGKTCPGIARRRQWEDVLLPAYLAGQPLEGGLMAADAQAILDALADLRRDHIVTGTTGLKDTTEKLYARAKGADLKADQALAQLAQLAAKVDALKAIVDGLALGRLAGDLDVAGRLHVEAAPPPAQG